ncbi:MAG: arginine--tRNA ligase [Asgard group archaeon]|nr:arginine--tRNA ligase [Asgard group archaeon]
MTERIYEYQKNILEKILEDKYDLKTSLIWSKPPSSDLGDISFPLFNVAKQLSIPPSELAIAIQESFSEPKYINKVEIQGGFLNLYLNKQSFSLDTLLKILSDAKYGQSTIKSSERIIVEHTSSNPTGPLHIGHFRNSILGDVIGRLFRFMGAAVNFRYYVNDLGRQIAPLIIGYHLLKEKGIEPNIKVDLWIGKIYATMNTFLEIQQLKEHLNSIGIKGTSKDNLYSLSLEETSKCKEVLKDHKLRGTEKEQIFESIDKLFRVQNSLEERIPDVYLELRKLTSKQITDLNQLTMEYVIEYQKGKDKELVSKFRKVTQEALAGHVETLNLFNIFHDDFDWESDVAWSGEVETILVKLEKNKFLIHDGKARLLDNDKIGTNLGFKEKYNLKYEMPSSIIVNSEGITLYPCRDIAYHLHKLEKFNASYCYNVVGKEQQFPQLTVKLALYGLGEPDIADKIEHFDFETVNLVGRKMAGREFEYVTPDEVYDLVKDEVNILLEERDYSEEEAKNISEKVATSSIKYFILRMDPKKLVVFDVKKAVNLNENTGPFLQYSYARALNIIKKAKENSLEIQEILSNAEQMNFDIEKEEEWELIKMMEELPYILVKAAESLRPDSVANFTYSLVAAFHKFYDSCPVLKANPDTLRDSRLLIVYCFLKCLESLFEVIGIDYLEKM